ncbi:MAG: hypothetical protein ACRDYA_13645 [Egibacteraceae bacterium]
MARLLFAMIAACTLVFACGPAPDVSSGPVGRPAPQQVEPRPGMADAEPVAWDRYEAGEDGRTLQVFWASGPQPCFVLDHVGLVQSAEAVTVTVHEGRDPEVPAGTPCLTILVTKTTAVVLDAPLGDRKVIDGAPAQGS